MATKNSVTLLFPGQGAQYIGMGKHLKKTPFYEYFTAADDILKIPLSDLMENGPADTLQLTENTQPAILTHSIALFKQLEGILKEQKIKIDRVLGHSVGEYSALVAAQAIDFKSALIAVKNRGHFMQKAVAPGTCKMCAVLRVPRKLVVQACQGVSTPNNIVMPANFNGPLQTVISGTAVGVDRVMKWLGKNFTGPMRGIELKVSAPFHSSLMAPAAKDLAESFTHITFYKNHYPYIANINGQEYPIDTSPEVIKKNLIDQVVGSVNWAQSIELLPDHSLCIEVGPGKVLAGLAKKINPTINTLSLDQVDAFDRLKEFIQ